MTNNQENNAKKQYLNSYLTLKMYLENIEILLLELSSEQDKYSLLSNNYESQSKFLINYLEDILIAKNEVLYKILNAISFLQSDNEKNILLLKYILGYTWEKISELTNYSLRQVYNIHTHALSHLKI